MYNSNALRNTPLFGFTVNAPKLDLLRSFYDERSLGSGAESKQPEKTGMTLEDALTPGVVATFQDQSGCEYDAFYLNERFYPLTSLDVKGVNKSKLSDICRVSKLKDIGNMNELFWGDNVEELTEVIWRRQNERDIKLERLRQMQEEIHKLEMELLVS